MLGGAAPVIIFTFPKLIPTGPNTYETLSGVPLLNNLQSLIQPGIPIPIYLDEFLTGIFIESETKAIDIETEVRPRFDGKPPDYSQRGLNSLITVNLLAKKDAILLGALFSLCDIVFKSVVSKEYNISYLNGSSTVFAGLLHGFQSQSNADNNLLNITLQISKANGQTTQPDSIVPVLPKITGATPVVVPS